MDLITELNDEQKKSWKKTIQAKRKQFIKTPLEYVVQATDQLNLSKETIFGDLSGSIQKIRDQVWEFYIQDESIFHQDVLSHLMVNESQAKKILINSLSNKNFDNSQHEIIANIIGECAGKVMPYIYELSLSTTNSRRSRSGSTFEAIIYHIMEIFEYSYVNQSHLGKEFFSQNDLGKKVDMIIPSNEAYQKNRAKCHIVTMKTSLRERWQEVVEEIERTNIPHLYLFTLDPTISSNTMELMKKYNITLVSYNYIQNRLSDFSNIISFEEYFQKELPVVIDYWHKNIT